MQLEQALKELKKHPWIDVRLHDWLIVLVHVDEDYWRDVNLIIEPLLTNTDYYVHMYSSVPSQAAIYQLIEKYPNFRYTYVPELIYTRLIDHDMGNRNFVSENAERVFCNLNHRPFIFREEIYQHMKTNYSNISYISWNSDPCYKNFEEDFKKPTSRGEEFYNVYIYPVTGFIFDIFAETYQESFVCITEKTHKGYFNGCIPVPFAATGTMRMMKDLGYDIFEDIVDFSYEMETHNQLRMEFYLKEIDRLSNTDLNITKSLTDRFAHNRQCFLNNIEIAKQKFKWIDKNTQISLNNREIYLGF